MKDRAHPDSYQLHNWPIYGPNDPEIANLVDRLAYDYKLRLREIEAVILKALEKRMLHEEGTAS